MLSSLTAKYGRAQRVKTSFHYYDPTGAVHMVNFIVAVWYTSDIWE